PRPRAPPPLHFVLRLRPPRRMPLHVAGRVGTAAGERHDVIDHVAGPAVRMTAPPHEIVLRRLTAMDAIRMTGGGAETGAWMRRVRPRSGRVAPRVGGVGARAAGVRPRMRVVPAATRAAPAALRCGGRSKKRTHSDPAHRL